jgi:ribonuclease HII
MTRRRDMLQSNFSGLTPECGCDEAGRGCLAGPVVAAAVILPPGFHHPLLNDSKQLSEKQRDELRIVIENEAVSWAVAQVEPEEIDRINILNASILAMHKAIEQLAVTPAFIIVDGNRFKPYPWIGHQTIVKGDARFMSIAAASVLAKTHRDELMMVLHQQYPQYNWKKNKAYPTPEHKKAIGLYGRTMVHRMTFKYD